MIEIRLFEQFGSFGEDKDKARSLRLEKIIPGLENGDEIILDFIGIEGATQSFIHALISDLFRNYGGSVLDKIVFKNCNMEVRKVIEMVSDYMQEAGSR